MTEVLERALEGCVLKGRPVEKTSGHVRSLPLPAAYFDIVAVANGFASRDGLFRFFGTEPVGPLPSIVEWNREDWTAQYGSLSAGLLFFGEDILGDQYAFDDARSSGGVRIVKFWCEGGERELLAMMALDRWLESEVLGPEPTIVDLEFVRQAASRGHRPALDQHLSFRLPLILGGEYEMENLETANARFHLSLLGQITARNNALPDGTPIKGFVEE